MYKLFRTRVLLLLFCSCVLSCGQRTQEEYSFPEFKKEYTREFDLLGQELDYGYVPSLSVYQDYLILVAYDFRSSEFLHILDKKTGEIMCSAAPTGRGPGELMVEPKMTLVGHEAYLYDRASRVTQVYDIEKILRGENGYCRTIQESDALFPPVGVFYGPKQKVIFSNRSYLHLDSTKISPRIILKKGARDYLYGDYPISDLPRTWNMYNTAYLTTSPDFSKMAIVPAYGGILERFSLLDGISLLGIDRFVAPDFNIKDGQLDYSVEHPLPLCFSALTSTNDRIYAGMANDGTVLVPGGKRKAPFFPLLAVFDWEGHPLIMIRNSLNIECLGYDETEGVAYAILNDADGNSHLGRMKI